MSPSIFKFSSFWRWLMKDFFGIIREMRWTYVPPLMVYLAAGISGFTGIIESFCKRRTGALGSFSRRAWVLGRASLGLEMPFGHPDLHWHRKSMFVYLGAALMAGSIAIMIGLTGHKTFMATIMALDKWYVIATLSSFLLQPSCRVCLAGCGGRCHDPVEAVPSYDENGVKILNMSLNGCT